MLNANGYFHRDPAKPTYASENWDALVCCVVVVAVDLLSVVVVAVVVAVDLLNVPVVAVVGAVGFLSVRLLRLNVSLSVKES